MQRHSAMIAVAEVIRMQSGPQGACMVDAFDVKPRWPLDLL